MASATGRFENLPVPLKLMTAGSAACFADFASFPLDTAKVRLQVQENNTFLIIYENFEKADNDHRLSH